MFRAVQETKKITIGDPLNRSTSHGPQNHWAHLKKLLEYVERGLEEGATLLYGGKRVDRSGYFLQPTILSDVSDENYVASEESFGPIMCVSKFDNGYVTGYFKISYDTCSVPLQNFKILKYFTWSWVQISSLHLFAVISKVS